MGPPGADRDDTTYRRSPAVTWDRTDDRVVILDPTGGTLITLNPVGSGLWLDLGEPAGAAELASRLATRFPDVEPDRLDVDVRSFLADLVEEGLVEPVRDR